MSDNENLHESRNPHWRDHKHTIYLNACHTIALAKIQAEYEIDKCAAVQLALNQGLFDMSTLDSEDYELLDKRYKRPLREIVEENKAKRENSHLPKTELEKQKREQLIRKESGVEQKEKTIGLILKGMYDEWDLHPTLKWRMDAVNYAKEHLENEYAKLLIKREKDCDNISQKSKESAI